MNAIGAGKKIKNLLHEWGTLVDCSTRFRATEAELAKKPVDNRREPDKFRVLKARIWMPSLRRRIRRAGFLSFGWAKTVGVFD
jgi:hypothetical protein